MNLAGEFPRGGEHQRPAAPGRGPLVVSPHPLDQREREGGRFAGTRLSAADQVAAGEQGRHRPDLDRCGHRVALGSERFEQLCTIFAEAARLEAAFWQMGIDRGSAA
jgi:hypothetical protein